jgi:hypothetical protein
MQTGQNGFTFMLPASLVKSTYQTGYDAAALVPQKLSNIELPGN